MKTTARAFLVTDRFVTRHIGPSPDETQAMLATLGYSSLDAFIDDVVPADIRLSRPLDLPPGRSEREVLQALRSFAAQNQLFRSYIGMGYYPCFTPQVVGALVKSPTTEGAIEDYARVCAAAHAVGALVTAATDLLALTLLQPPGEWGADIAVGSSQRFGVPMGYGGPHAAFFATRDEYKRHLPGRIIGLSREAGSRPALRMTLQTREQA